jgi:hypothetical protein
MINIVLLLDSTWVFWVTAHLMIDPTLIVLSTSNEWGLLAGLMIVALVFDVIALLYTSLTLAVYGIWVQIILTLAGLSMLFMPTTVELKDTPPPTAIAQPVDVETTKPKSLTRRRVKSSNSDIAF